MELAQKLGVYAVYNTLPINLFRHCSMNRLATMRTFGDCRRDRRHLPIIPRAYFSSCDQLKKPTISCQPVSLSISPMFTNIQCHVRLSTHPIGYEIVNWVRTVRAFSPASRLDWRNFGGKFISKFSTQSVGSRRKLVGNSIHTGRREKTPTRRELPLVEAFRLRAYAHPIFRSG